MSDYRPIACDRHDIYEVAILRSRPLRLSWHQQGTTRHATVHPRDLIVADGAEWLIAEDSDHGSLRLRLDWISHTEVVEN